MGGSVCWGWWWWPVAICWWWWRSSRETVWITRLQEVKERRRGKGEISTTAIGQRERQGKWNVSGMQRRSITAKKKNKAEINWWAQTEIQDVCRKQILAFFFFLGCKSDWTLMLLSQSVSQSWVDCTNICTCHYWCCCLKWMDAQCTGC